jgi:hypothetical protein
MTLDRMRNDRFLCTVAVDSIGPLPDAFDTCTGGDTDSTESKYRPGGMSPMVSLGGSTDVANVVVSRNFALGRDDVLLPKLRAAAGRRTATVTLQPLDADRNAFGTPQTYRGVLQRVQGPQHDSTSTDAAMMELEINPSGTVA